MSAALSELPEHTCQRCRLSSGRTHIVMPDGPRDSVMAVGEAPGAKEDESAVGFAGPAGRNLDLAFEAAAGLARHQYARANIVRCRPPGNRKPRKDEVQTCLGWLEQAVEAFRPRILLAVGQSAAEVLTPFRPGSSYIAYVDELLAAAERGGRTALPLYLNRFPVVAMPHSSPLAWNRKTPDGRPLRELGHRAIGLAAALAD